MKSEPLSKVAPARTSDRHISADTVVWQLTLDQIVSGSGVIANRIYAPFKDAGASTFVFDERNVLYSKLRPYLNKVVCPESIGVATTELVPLRPDPKKLDRNYLCYYLRSPAFVGWISSQVAGAKMPRVSMKSFWSHQIPLPPLEDQIRIAHLLSKVEGLIAQRKQQLQQLDDLLKSVFLKMFGINDGTYKKWPTTLLENQASVSSGVTKGKKYVSQHMVEVPYLRVANVQDGYFDLDEIKTITVSEEESIQCQLKRGDLLLTEGGDRDKLGRGSVWDEQIANCIHQNHIFRVRISDDNSLSPIYLSALVGSTYGKTYFLKSAKQTTGIASINSTQLKRFPIIMAPFRLQTHYCDISKAITRLRSIYRDSCDEAELLFRQLSLQAFSGGLDLSLVPALIDSANPNIMIRTPSIDYVGNRRFDLPTPAVPPKAEAYRARELALIEWLEVYIRYVGNRQFSAEDFLSLVQQKLSSMEENADAEWVSEPVGAKDYEQVKAWVFENLQNRQLQQTYDDRKNRVRVSKAKD